MCAGDYKSNGYPGTKLEHYKSEADYKSEYAKFISKETDYKEPLRSLPPHTNQYHLPGGLAGQVQTDWTHHRLGYSLVCLWGKSCRE